ncbi:MAG: LysE family transporter, partial [Arenibacter algicola]|nr:LysE family transporter [Arenibacter algicola]
MEHLLTLFFATFSAAFMATVPPGLLNMNAAKISVEKGKTNGIIFSLGVSTMIIIQAYISVLISKFLFKNPEIIDLLLKIALIVFAFFAIYFFVKAKKKKLNRPKIVKVS